MSVSLVKKKSVFSIIIPTRNNVQFLSQCLGSIITYTKLPYDITVVTNGQLPHDTNGYISGISKIMHKTGRKVHIKCIHSPKEGFAAACNEGLKHVTGDYAVLLNDDTLVAPNWDKEILQGFIDAKTAFPNMKWGYAGPMSNKVKGQQALNPQKLPAAFDPSGLSETAEKIKSHPSFIPKGDISGFCLVISRDLLKEIKQLHDFTKGGFEDNDFCVRAQDSGFAGLIAARSFIFHFGHQSLQRFEQENPFGIINVDKYLTLWHKETYNPDAKLCISYAVKIDNNEDYNIFKRSLDKAKEVADWVVILDDKSELPLHANLVMDGYKDFIVDFKRNPDSLPRDEPRDRKKIYEMASATGCDWIWNLDHDEVPDSRCTRAKMLELMNPANPEVRGFIFPMATFWRGEELIRVDSTWQNLFNRGMVRNEPTWGTIAPMMEKANVHSFRIPNLVPNDVMQFSYAFTVKHYGYTHIEKVIRKQKFYQEVDTLKDKILIGSDNYEHLTDETGIQLAKFREPTISLLYMTKNSLQDLACRYRQYRDVFNEFVVMDTGSTDGTVEWCKEMGIAIHLYSCCDKSSDKDHILCNFSAARNVAIGHCKSDYILFMDPDEEFDQNSIKHFDKVLLEDADAYVMRINNLNRNEEGKQVNYVTRQPRLFRNTPEIRYNDYVHETLEKSLKDKYKLYSPFVVIHYGFLRTNKEERREKNEKYAELLKKIVAEEPDNYRALYALGIHYVDVDLEVEGEQLLAAAYRANPTYWNSRWDLSLRYFKLGLDLLTSTPDEIRPQDERWKCAENIIKALITFYPKRKLVWQDPFVLKYLDSVTSETDSSEPNPPLAVASNES